MSRKNWQIPRRTFLRGLGASIALPALDAMIPPSAAAVAAPKPPVRMACLYFPNGVWPENWIPKEAGENYTLPFSLEPLAPAKDRVLVISGLDKAASRQGDGHYAKTANFLTGTPITKTVGKDISAGGISMDQLIAGKIGHLTPLPSLELGIDPVISGIDGNVGYTRLYGSYISWRSPTTPVAKEINPRFVYERLFGSAQTVGDAKARDRRRVERRSLLDAALDQARDLRRNLGRDDQIKMDEYLDSLRAVEKRIDFSSRPDPRDWKPESAPARMEAPAEKLPKDYREHVKLMLDLMVLAFQTDSTRVSTFMFANAVSGRSFSFLEGVEGGHHDLSHHGKDEKKIEGYSKINRWHVEQYVYLLDRLGSIREGEGTLLDHSMILMGSGLSDGDRHDPNNLPILLGGRGGGAIRSGRHLANPKNTPLCNLYLSMLECMGTSVDSFGDSAGYLNDMT
ncbi:DUF1552 domain-containing protein [Candidatus Sumerlaeota bacterium]|nr:DUF1552 domain-containing protein [Candidatus Sumerlaeota bacterium]